MAIKKIMNLTGNRVLQTSFGTVSEGSGTLAVVATIRVVEITGNAEQVNARISFTDGLVNFQKVYAVPVSTEDGQPNFIRQVYLHLKTLPEFENCEDC
jgi:hypothetical protein